MKPENVCWDLTMGIQADDPDGVPVVFGTGYRIDYSGPAAWKPHPLPNANPARARRGLQGQRRRSSSPPGAALFSIMDPAFDPKGKKYSQLTPDGPLPPVTP